MSDHDEKCQRCGEEGEDRRTLQMACFYAMDELNVPFTKYSIHGTYCAKIGGERHEIFNVEIPKWAEPEGEASHHPMFQLRVCKRCRSQWMQAIEQWFRHTADDPQGSGTGVYIRDNGHTREATYDEVAAMSERVSAEPDKGEGD